MMASGASGAFPFALHTAMRSDVGMVRSDNEDSISEYQPKEAAALATKGALFVVADGMGGAQGGRQASALVVQTINAHYMSGGDEEPGEALREAVVEANRVVHEYARTHPELKGMGSTCTALVIRNREAYFAHVGDTRLYLVRGGSILQVTDDHSKVARLVRDGFLSPEQAEAHPERNVLLRSIGPKSTVEVDVPLHPVPLTDGDRLVMCSDGLTNHVRDREILECVQTLSPDDAADALVKLARERGGSDNISVGVIGVGPRGAGPRGAGPTGRRGGPPQTRVDIPSLDERSAAHRGAKKSDHELLRNTLVAAVALALLGGAVWLWFWLRSPAPAMQAEARPVPAAEPHRDALATKPSNEKPSNEKPSNEKPSNEKPSNEKPSKEKPSNEKPSNEKPSEEATGEGRARRPANHPAQAAQAGGAERGPMGSQAATVAAPPPVQADSPWQCLAPAWPSNDVADGITFEGAWRANLRAIDGKADNIRNNLCPYAAEAFLDAAVRDCGVPYLSQGFRASLMSRLDLAQPIKTREVAIQCFTLIVAHYQAHCPVTTANGLARLVVDGQLGPGTLAASVGDFDKLCKSSANPTSEGRE